MSRHFPDRRSAQNVATSQNAGLCDRLFEGSPECWSDIQVRVSEHPKKGSTRGDVLLYNIFGLCCPKRKDAALVPFGCHPAGSPRETRIPMQIRAHQSQAWKLLGFLAAFATCLTAGTLVPAIGLQPGVHYRLVFVTSTTRDAGSSNILDYDLFVTTTANADGSLLQPLGLGWLAAHRVLPELIRDPATRFGGSSATETLGGR